MNATATQSFKFRISQRMVWMMVLSAVFLYSLYVALAEQNGMAALGCITTIVCVIFVLDVGQKLHGRVPLLDKKNRVELYFVVLMLPYSCVASFVHLASDYKVWIANGKTTLNHDFLVRMPLAPLAKSVNVNQNKTYEYSAKTKDGYLVSATISGTFRLTESEGEIVSTFSSMEESPDRVIAMALNQVMGKAFADAMAKVDASELPRLINTFALEIDVGTATRVRELGLKRNGVFKVSSLHPYFIDR